MTISATTKRTLRYSLAATLLLSCAPVALHAEPSDKDEKIRKLETMMLQMQSQIRSLKAAVGEDRVENRRTREKVREVAIKGYAPAPYAAIPEGATPVLVTADKKFQFGALTITPGGFMAGESVFRSKTTQSDINSAWNNIPYVNSPLSRTNEYRLTGRQSRLALLAEGAITPTMIASGYAEFDFLGAGTTSNATDTNSYAPRIRVLYAALDNSDYGIHALAGQMWSLTTLNSKGITPRNEVPPPTIDGQFLPGFIFARQAGVRLTKDFDKKLWLSLGLEEAQTTFTNGACAGSALSGTTNSTAGGGLGETQAAQGVGVTATGGVTSLCAATASGAGFSQYGQPYSLNHLPDVIAKAAYEAKLGDRDIHLEGMGLYKDLYNATYSTNAAGFNANIQTHDVAGYGFGGGLIAAVVPKKLDFQIQAMAGRGIGRYGAGLLADSTIGADGQLKPIGEVIGMAGLTFHATPAIDVYAFGGIEQEGRNYNDSNGAFFGYGVPNAANYGCGIVGAAAATCTGQTHRLWQVTGGFWDKLYKGSFGEVRVGMQYSYTERDGYGTQNAATPAGAASAGLTVAQASQYFLPKTNNNTVLTSIRYYPFQ